LVIWVADRGGQLHTHWQRLIELELDRFASMEREGKTSELDEIRSHAPKAIPGSLMRTLWRLLLGGRMKSQRQDLDLYRWKGRLNRDGLTTTLRLELRELLTPKVVLKKPLHWGDDNLSLADETKQIKQMVKWELTLAADHVHSAIRDLDGEHWTSTLPRLLIDFQQLLCDALDLLRELGDADDQSDPSYWDLPLITPHWQNRGFRDWVGLIELLREAWKAVRAIDSARATAIAQNWFELPYPTFKRLALFAASQDDCISPEQWGSWLSQGSTWWLWATDTRREVFRLFVLQGQNLPAAVQEKLEAAILAGPPRSMYHDDLAEDRRQELVVRSIWLRLAKLIASGLALGTTAALRFADISNAYSQWQVASDERDEFSHWMSATGDPDYEDRRDVNMAPHKRWDLVEWLKRPVPKHRPFYEDTWRDVCRNHFANSLFALCDLSQNGEWPSGRWREALQVWAEERIVFRTWKYAALLVQTMPDVVLQEIDNAVTSWIQSASKSINCHEDILLHLCSRVLALSKKADSSLQIIQNGVETYDPVGLAINHPIGHVTQALINLWLKQSPRDNDLLPFDLKRVFTKLCDVDVERFRHGRVLLGSRLITLFRVDRPWVEQHLLPLFDWANPVEAKAVWEGFLWSPRLYQPLLTAFKLQFLDSANHYIDLGEHRRQFATLLTYVALGPTDGYTVDEFRSAIAAFPQEGLEECAQALSQALEGAADRCEDYWDNRAQPFWQQIWPKSRDLATPRIAESLTRLVIASRGKFPTALAAVKDWLRPIERPDYAVRLLHRSSLCQRFPLDGLTLLNTIIGDGQWAPRELGQCLEEIVLAAPNLTKNPNYRRLNEYSRRRGI
jgi:hypothetical protein